MTKLSSPSMSQILVNADKKRTNQYFSIVKKSNLMIRKARYSLSLQQQKVLCYLIAHLSENDTHETEKIFDIKAFYDFMEVNNKDYDKVRQALKTLADKSWWIQTENCTDILVRFLNTVKTNKRSGKARIKFHEDILPYLQQLKTQYTTYKIYYIMTMKSQYSIRLYELLKSVAGKELWYFDIDELRQIFMCEEKYDRVNDFKKRIIEPSIEEINNKTDLNVTYEYFTEGRKIVGIEFYISYKSVEDRLNVDRKIRNELDKNYVCS
jgi:plasmid replication initiation protein